MLTLKSLLRAVADAEARGFTARALGVLNGKKEAAQVAALMMTGIAVQAIQPASAVAALAGRHGLARVPVIDGAGKLLGMAGPVEVLDAFHGVELAA